IKYAFCPKCGEKVKGYFTGKTENGLLGSYHVFKFNCVHYEGNDDYLLCANFTRRFRFEEKT
ncbi:MAG TPA: hypothetical protein PKC44_12740, partial [Agitococcus sp.]|nr:hypothetical protein [Agitococcus sp.]